MLFTPVPKQKISPHLNHTVVVTPLCLFHPSMLCIPLQSLTNPLLPTSYLSLAKAITVTIQADDDHISPANTDAISTSVTVHILSSVLYVSAETERRLSKLLDAS